MEKLLAMAAQTAIFYALFSFVKADIDFTHWDEMERLVFIFINSVGWIYLTTDIKFSYKSDRTEVDLTN